MPTLYLDTCLEEAQLDHGADFTRRVRPFIVKDLGVVANDFAALEKALAVGGMPQLNDLHPVWTNTRVVRHVMRGLAGDQVKGVVIYETPTGGTVAPPNGSFILRDSTALVSEITEINPVTGEPLAIYYRPSPSSDNTAPAVTKDIVSVQYLVPMRILSLFGIITNRPSAAMLDAIGCINQNAWQGLGKGFWLCSAFTGETGDLVGGQGFDQRYQVEASFMTRQRRDWSSFATYKDERGKTPSNIRQDGAQFLLGLPYDNIVHNNPNGQGSANGLMKSGLYPPADFLALFGV
jgi:hypothetical protein